MIDGEIFVWRLIFMMEEELRMWRFEDDRLDNLSFKMDLLFLLRYARFIYHQHVLGLRRAFARSKGNERGHFPSNTPISFLSCNSYLGNFSCSSSTTRFKTKTVCI